MVKLHTKIKRYIGLLLLIAIVGLFFHSEIMNRGHVDESHKQHDYCNIVSHSANPQQSNIQHSLDYNAALIPSIHIFTVYEEKNKVILFNSYTPLADISCTILFQSFLI